MAPSIPRWAYGALVLIVGIAALFRFVALDYAPAGGHGDVAWIGINALDWIDHGIWPFYVRELYAPEPFPVYLTGLLLPLTGISYLPQRLITASMGVLFVAFLFPATWWLLEGRNVAFRTNASLLATLAGATSLHIVALNRLGMESPPFLTVLTLLIWLTARAWRRSSMLNWELAGAALALSQYVFLAARLLPIVLALWIGYGWFLDRERMRSQWRGWLVMAATSFVLTLPALILFITTPEAFSARADAGTAQTGGWIWHYDTAAFGGPINLIIQKIGLTLFAFGIRWDGPYNIMNLPMLGPLFFVGFLVAIPVGLRRFRDYGYAWSLLAIPIMLITDLISGAVLEIHALHQMGVLPFVVILSGMGLAHVIEFIQRYVTLPAYSLAMAIGVTALLPAMISMNNYLTVTIPNQYADPQASWGRAQTDVDLGRYLVNHADQSFLLPYSEYSRSDVAWTLADGFRYRRSAINGQGVLDLPYPPQRISVVMTGAPERPRHDGFPSHFDPRLWVLLHDNHVWLLPPFTTEQVSEITDVTASTELESLTDRSGTIIANVYHSVESADFFKPRPVVDYSLDAIFNNEIQLLGYTLPSQDLEPGAITFVTLFWKPLVQPREDYEVFIQLWDDEQRSLSGAHDFPWGGMYRTRIWQPDEVVVTHHWIEVSPDLGVGRYSLVAGLFRLLHNENVSVVGEDTDIERQLVRAGDLRFPPPPPTFIGAPPLRRVQFGELFSVAGLDFERSNETLLGNNWTLVPGDQLNVDVLWEVYSRPQKDYSVFLHLVQSPDQSPVAQTDQMIGGAFPTGAWRTNERFHDRLTLRIPDKLKPGNYDVLLGVYFWQTGERLPAYHRDTVPIDNHIKIGEVVITDR